MASLSIGLDIGPQTVRAVALAPATSRERKEGVPFRVLATAAVHRRGDDNDLRPLDQVVEETLAILGRKGPTQVHLGDSPSLVRFIATMPLPPDRQARVLRLELASNTESDGDLAADTWVVPQPGDEVIHACVIGQAPVLVAALAELAQGGLGDVRIHHGPAAAYNATLPSGPVRGDDLALLIDLGETSSNVTLLGEDRILACRQVAQGGGAFPANARHVAGPEDPPSEPEQIFVPLEKTEERVKVRQADASFDEMLEAAVEPAAPAQAPAKPTTLDLDDSPFTELVLDDTPSGPPPVADAIPLNELVFDDPALDGPIPTSSEAKAPAIPRVSATQTTLPLTVPAAGAMTMLQAQATLSPEAIRVAEALYGQFASSLVWFRTQLKRDKIPLAKVLLTGATATIPGLADYFQRRFGCPVEIFDPFAGATGAIPDDPHAWTAAVGLALAHPRLAPKHALELDLRPESLVRRDLFRRHLIWPWVAAGLVLASTILVGWTLIADHQAVDESRQAWEDYTAKHKKLTADLAVVAKDQEALGEDLRAIAGRIWAGRDLLYTVRALKERTAKSPELWVIRLETVGVGTDQAATPVSGRVGSIASKPVADTAIGRGAVLLTGKIKFTSAATDTGRNKFLTEWKDWITEWRPSPDAPRLFSHSIMDEWDPKHQEKKSKDGSLVDSGEFTFTARFIFTPTSFDQVTAAQSPGATP